MVMESYFKKYARPKSMIRIGHEYVNDDDPRASKRDKRYKDHYGL